MTNTMLGIKQVEQLAMDYESSSDPFSCSYSPFERTEFEEEEIIELVTRMQVKSRLARTLAKRLDAAVLEQLMDVFFRLTYPTPPTVDAS